jgi:uncharacterized damage-inducible protein DinB
MTPSTGPVLDSLASTLASQKRMAERAIEQLDDGQLRQPLDENTNSVAVIAKHMAGNMLSRWTDFLTTDGEKPWRDRDGEFVDTFASREKIMAFWEKGWDCLFGSLGSLTEADLGKTVRLRGQELTAINAIHSHLSHYGYHMGQIVLSARLLAKDNWNTLTVPRAGS